jgi:molecular chaperone DnaK
MTTCQGLETVKQIFGKEPNRGVNPDEVAHRRGDPGGVLQGEVKDVLLLDVTRCPGHRDLGRRLHPPDRPQHDDPDQKSQTFSTAETTRPR